MPAPAIDITVLGSGTSVGVPTIGCPCAVCHSTDPRDNRLRPSILVSYAGRNILVDTTPDFRTQALRAGIDRLDAVIYTHSHADHIMGLDDVRPFNFRQQEQIPIYAAPDAMETIQRTFRYIFDGQVRNTNIPQLAPRLLEGAPIDLFGVEFIPVPLLHGRATILRLSFRGGGLPDGPQRDPRMRRWTCCAVSTCCFWTRCATSRIPPIRRWSARVLTAETVGRPAHLVHAHLPRPWARGYGSGSASPHPAGVRRSADSRSRPNEDLSTPGRCAARFRPLRAQHREFRRRAPRPPADSAEGARTGGRVGTYRIGIRHSIRIPRAWWRRNARRA